MEIVKGNYLVKNNFTLFGGSHLPVIKVETVVDCLGKKGGPTGNLKINGASIVPKGKVSIVSEEEAIRILAIWDDCKNLSELSDENFNNKCSRDDNGQPKATYVGECGWRTPLFVFRMKNPDGGFQAYTCPICSQVHIGKSFNELKVEKKNLKDFMRFVSNDDLFNASKNYFNWKEDENPKPWETYDDLTTKISKEYRIFLSGDGIVNWKESFKYVAVEIARRITVAGLIV